MEAGEGVGGAAGGAGGQGGPGSAGGSGGPSAGPAGPSGAGGEGAAAGGAPQVEGIVQVSGRDGAAGGRPNQLLEFTLTVPFLSFMEAEVARRSLIAEAEPYRGEVHKELRVAGSDLIVRLTADNPGILQISITSFLNELSQVMRTMQHIGPPFFARPPPGKGG